METRSMISFDWAMKRLLRQKANFEVLEGFLSELLRRKIIIKNIGESEGNKMDENDKWNKVDILVEADEKELVIIELQYDSENDYYQRMLYGVSKAVTEYIHVGEPYSAVRKVYSINIVYFDLGKGDDYVYHGITNFTGLHTHTELQLSDTQQQLYGKTVVGELHPEYYIIKVKKFSDVAHNTLDQWIYYLKNNKIRDDFTAQGIEMARQILALDKLTDSEKKQYWRNVEERRVRDSEISTAYLEGETKGLARGEAQRTQLETELKEKAEKEIELLARIAALEQQISDFVPLFLQKDETRI
jgi:predicted transposase/invertase (TIGR01784 family)